MLENACVLSREWLLLWLSDRAGYTLNILTKMFSMFFDRTFLVLRLQIITPIKLLSLTEDNFILKQIEACETRLTEFH